MTASTASSNPPLLSDSTDSADTLGLARTWIQDCLENHDKFKNKSLQKWRPTRLLKIDSPYPDYISLDVDSKQPSLVEFEPYMTLSHCWGDSQPMKLTVGTYANLLKGILISKLPKTFLDAVRMTRSLCRRNKCLVDITIATKSQETPRFIIMPINILLFDYPPIYTYVIALYITYISY
jgi:hypothetical protein